MSLELLKPVSENLIDELDENYSQGSLFNKIKFHREQSGIPDINSSNLSFEYRIYNFLNSF